MKCIYQKDYLGAVMKDGLAETRGRDNSGPVEKIQERGDRLNYNND